MDQNLLKMHVLPRFAKRQSSKVLEFKRFWVAESAKKETNLRRWKCMNFPGLRKRKVQKYLNSKVFELLKMQKRFEGFGQQKYLFLLDRWSFFEPLRFRFKTDHLSNGNDHLFCRISSCVQNVQEMHELCGGQISQNWPAPTGGSILRNFGGLRIN